MAGPACGWSRLGIWAFGLNYILWTTSAQAASTVPVTLNGLITNNSTGQAGWGGFENFTYNGSFIGPSSVGQYTAFVFDSDMANGGTQMNGSGTGWNNLLQNEAPYDQLTAFPILDVRDNDYPIYDRAGYGTNFDPDLYRLEVVYKPLPTNEAPVMNITLDTYDGFKIEDRYQDPPANTMPWPNFGIGKRYAEQQQWGFGYADITGNGTTNDGMGGQRGLTIQEYYDANPKDADGFVTVSGPLTDGIGGDSVVTPSDWWRFTGPSFLFVSGSTSFQAANAIPGDMQPDFADFENLTPNGVVQIHLQSAYIDDAMSPNLGRLHLEVKRISIVPINPDPTEVARMDAMSGVGRRFGTPFFTTYSPDGATAVDVPIMHEGNTYVIRETDQLQRFDQSGFTNLIINTDDDDQLGGFGAWQDPQYQTFDGREASLEVRARLTAPLDANHADMIGIVLNDLDGNDLAPGEGGEEYRYNIDLNQFNQTTFETISIPLMDFDNRQVAFELVNDGDTSLEDFNLYYLGVLVDQGTPGSDVPEQVIDLAIEYVRVVLPPQGVAGDYNENDVVDAADYTTWRDHLGQSIALPNTDSNDTDGMVTNDEYAFWKSRFGATSGAGSGALAAASSAVPEPAACSLWLLALGIAAPTCRRRRSRKGSLPLGR